MRMRLAQADDRELVWRWANDPSVRANSFSTDRIPWDDHVAWFDRTLTGDERVLLIAEDGDGPFGQVRFERGPEGYYEIGLSIVSSHRGRGLASDLIRAAMVVLGRMRGVVTVRARIRPHNPASQRSFEGAGFSLVGQREDGAVVLETTTAPQQPNSPPGPSRPTP